MVDGKGKVWLERELPCEIEDIADCLEALEHPVELIGFDAGALSQYLYFGLQLESFDVVCMEARQVTTALSAIRNKTDKTDAKDIAQILRTGWFSRAHIKSREAHGLQALMSKRNALLKKAMGLANEDRALSGM
ncbi:IS110 family transposase [Sulfitobacter sp.]|uniref:IS110 family transposase n=1 Tax=Sulfitobacter sp. TaxID=1903071 RepID=UPI003002EEF3